MMYHMIIKYFHLELIKDLKIKEYILEEFILILYLYLRV